ncbi:MAG: hypothetical protein MK108_15395 [Mariniblastus sp.]|nr:hypothetical protein [Mariniblastus sp.]
MKTQITHRNNPQVLGPSERRTKVARILTMGTALSLLTLLLASPAWALEAAESSSVDGLRIKTTVQRDQARIAEPIEMTIEVEAPQDVLVRFPESLDQLGTFDVVEIRDDLDIPFENGRQFTRHMKLENIHAGEQAIPSLDVAYVDQRTEPPVSGILKTGERVVTIATSLEGPENPIEFRDIKGVVFLDVNERSSPTWIFWTTGGLLATLALALVLVRNRRNLTPRQWALNALDDFENSGDLFRASPELVYVTLTDIIRQFVQRQFDLSAPRLTTKEFLHELQTDSRLNVDSRNQLSEFLQVADMVKFAGLAPGSDAIQLALANARTFIHESDQTEDESNSKQFPPGKNRFKEFE